MNAEHALLTLKLVEEAARVESERPVLRVQDGPFDRAQVEPALQWRQHSYRCQTGQCFAGWASLAAGARWVVPSYSLSNLSVEDSWNYAKIETPDGRVMDVADHAVEVLEIGPHQESLLFASGNSVDRLRALVEKFIAWDEQDSAC